MIHSFLKSFFFGMQQIKIKIIIKTIVIFYKEMSFTLRQIYGNLNPRGI